MVDRQFSSQNGGNGVSTVSGLPGLPTPGISLIVAPPGPATTNTIEQNKPNRSASSKQDGKKIQISDNMTTVDRVVLCAAEICGTAILLFLGCVGCIDFSEGKSPPSHLAICLTFGLAVMIAVQCFGHISGSHINPVVTVAAATLGNIPLIQVPIYFVGQILGALAGVGLLKAATPDKFLPSGGVGICSPHLNADVSPFQGFLIEFIICFLLTLVCCGVWDVRNNTKHDSVPIRFGLTISGLALAAGPYTGANMNPARSFAPALINGDWANHWIYWVGPLSAAFLGALLYRFLFTKEVVEEDLDHGAEVIPLNDAKA